MKGIKYTIMLHHTLTVLLEYINHSLQFTQMLDVAIDIYCTLPYYAGNMLDAFSELLCWHNRQVPSPHYTHSKLGQAIVLIIPYIIKIF